MRQLVISPSITPRECRSLDKYFNEVDKISLLTSEQEADLAKKIHTGDPLALESLVKANLRFVISVAKQYQNQGLTLGDLINEGNIGLMVAAGRYDETKGFKFISYAVWWIRQFIVAAIARQARMIRLPYNQLGLLNNLYKTLAVLEQKNGRTASLEEVAECLEVPVKMVAELLHKAGAHISFDSTFRQDENHTWLDILQDTGSPADARIISDSVRKEIKYSLKVLSSRERELLILFFGLDNTAPQTMEDIGKRFNISKEHAGRLKTKALDKLRNCSRAKTLLSCLV